MPEKLIFVTVGTTNFDNLINSLNDLSVLLALRAKGYDGLLLQIGNGTILPKNEVAEQAGFNLTYYRYKDFIKEDILKSDLVISHAGAGTCLEVLELKKPLLVVVNEELMHNHQTELADKLSSDGYLYACSCDTLLNTIKVMDVSKLKIMPPANPKLFTDFLDNFMGFKKKSS